MVEYPTRIAFLYNVSNGDTVYVLYDSPHSEEEQRIEGTVKDATLSEWTRVETGDVDYLVYGQGVKGRTPGDVVKETGDRRRKVGRFNRADRL